MVIEQTKILHRAFLQSKVENLKPRTAHVLPLVASVQDAVRAFKSAHVGSVLVLDDEEVLKGIFTERDLVLKYPSKRALRAVKVTELMTDQVQFISPRSSIARLLHLVALGGFRHVPVIGTAKDIKRIISVRDIINYLYRVIAKKLIAENAEKIVHEDVVDKFFNVSVRHLKSAPPVWIDPDSTAQAALNIMHKTRCGSLLVSAKGQVARGIFTERDFAIRVVAEERPLFSTKITDVMTPNCESLSSDDSIATMFKLMSESGYRHVPIAEKDGKISSVASTQDLITLLTQSVLDELSKAQH